MTEAKTRIYWQVLNAALDLDFQKGHLKWTMSHLSRKSGVTRSLIYYYFGKSKQDILIAAVRLVGEELFGLNPEKLRLWESGQVTQAILTTRGLMERSPHLSSFYLQHRPRPNPVGQEIRGLESRHLAKLGRFFPKARKEDLQALFAVFFGLASAPELSRDSISRTVESAIRLLKKSSK